MTSLAAMLVYWTIAKKSFGNLALLLLLNMSYVFLFFCTPTWPSDHVSANQEYGTTPLRGKIWKQGSAPSLAFLSTQQTERPEASAAAPFTVTWSGNEICRTVTQAKHLARDDHQETAVTFFGKTDESTIVVGLLLCVEDTLHVTIVQRLPNLLLKAKIFSTRRAWARATLKHCYRSFQVNQQFSARKAIFMKRKKEHQAGTLNNVKAKWRDTKLMKLNPQVVVFFYIII